MFEKRRQALALKTIKRYLSDDFKKIRIKDVTSIPDLSDLMIYSKGYKITAKIVENKTIHLKIETVCGMVYEWFSENYTWFLDTFYLE